VNNAFLSGFVQGAYGVEGGLAGIFHFTFLDCQLSIFNLGSRVTAKNTVSQASLFILPNSFNCRWFVSQGTASSSSNC
jgi:hypothetical protein